IHFNVVDTPSTQAGRDIFREVEREPPVDDRAPEILALFNSAEQIARRMTVAAMAQSLHQIGAAIPGGRLRGVRCERPLLCDKSSGAWLLGLTCCGLLCTVRAFSPVCVLRATYG